MFDNINDYNKFLQEVEKNCQLACNLWLEEFGFSTRVDGQGIWGYALEMDTIEIEIYEDAENIAYWESFLYDYLNFSTHYGVFVTSFLHELGHAQTIEFFTDEDIQLSHKALSPFEYFESPIEIAATSWAINYMKEHREQVNLLAELLQPILNLIEEY
jgi:hypothetical protein